MKNSVRFVFLKLRRLYLFVKQSTRMKPIKQTIITGSEEPSWVKGSKAIFNYTAFVYREAKNIEKCDKSHSHTEHSHKQESNKSNQPVCKNDDSRPVRVKISDSKLDEKPFELR